MTAKNRTATNYQAGLAAEAAIARLYHARGYTVRHMRWRAVGGELDIVLQNGPQVVFCEVKKGPTFERVAERLTPQKWARIVHTAQAYLAKHGLDQSTELRFDVGLLDVHGHTKILENIQM
ncbi:MAG: YraN family protein [Pseudomonadota bacterium]